MNKLTKHSSFESFRNSEHKNAVHLPDVPKRKQLLLRCGWKFYVVYEDDGSLVDDKDLDVAVVQRYPR